MTLRAAIFDVDGVLVASPHELAWREALAGFADPALFTTEFYQAYVAGKPRFDGARAALERLGVPNAAERAIEYATRACEWTAWKNPTYLDTLASAYAEAGQFEDAVRYQTRTLEEPALKGDFRTAAMQRLELYRQKKPFRDQGP